MVNFSGDPTNSASNLFATKDLSIWPSLRVVVFLFLSVHNAVSGLIYTSFAAQPLTLLGPTGFMVVITGALYRVSRSWWDWFIFGLFTFLQFLQVMYWAVWRLRLQATKQAMLPFLPIYGWVGIWSCVFLLGLGAMEASSEVIYFAQSF